MRKVFGITCLLVCFVTNLYSQNSFYLNPNIGVVWNAYDNSNPNITGNEDVANIFWDNDFNISLLVGYEFSNNITIESGVQYHNAVNRYHLNYSELTSAGGTSVSLGEGFLDFPLNLKYNIKTGVGNLKLVPFLGVLISTHKINSNPYSTMYDLKYEENADPFTSVPIDTIAVVTAYRPSKTNILINGGIGLEYTFFKRIIFTLSGNFTTGFNNMNKLTVVVFREDQTEYGEIIYKGTKFYLSAGIKIPIKSKERVN